LPFGFRAVTQAVTAVTADGVKPQHTVIRVVVGAFVEMVEFSVAPNPDDVQPLGLYGMFEDEP